MERTLPYRVERALWAAYPNQNAFLRRGVRSWSAELVPSGQYGPPYRTKILAEAATLEELAAQLGIEIAPVPPDGTR